MRGDRMLSQIHTYTTYLEPSDYMAGAGVYVPTGSMACVPHPAFQLSFCGESKSAVGMRHQDDNCQSSPSSCCGFGTSCLWLLLLFFQSC